jgi:hypothetical protein
MRRERWGPLCSTLYYAAICARSIAYKIYISQRDGLWTITRLVGIAIVVKEEFDTFKVTLGGCNQLIQARARHKKHNSHENYVAGIHNLY